jgi:CheY-like chemotaxis protein
MSKCILVVEDQPDNRRIIRDMLAPTDCGCFAVKAAQGDEDGTRNAKEPDAIQVVQTYTVRRGAGPDDCICFRAVPQ